MDYYKVKPYFEASAYYGIKKQSNEEVNLFTGIFNEINQAKNIRNNMYPEVIEMAIENKKSLNDTKTDSLYPSTEQYEKVAEDERNILSKLEQLSAKFQEFDANKKDDSRTDCLKK